MVDISLDDLLRNAVSGGYNLVQVDAFKAFGRRVRLTHRGHSGASDDIIIHQLTDNGFMRLRAEMRRRAATECTSDSGSRPASSA